MLANIENSKLKYSHYIAYNQLAQLKLCGDVLFPANYLMVEVTKCCYISIADIILERPFTSLILLEGTKITLTCNPTLLPHFVTLYWTHNGVNISDTTNGIRFSPNFLNHNLIIESPVVSDSGIYHCIAAPSVRESFNVTILESKFTLYCVAIIQSTLSHK